MEKGKQYRVVPKGTFSKKYLKDKYGTDIVITIEAPTYEVWPNGDWEAQSGNFACLLYAMRSGADGMPYDGAYYGKIGAFGEIVHESELEEIK
jgi:ABC-type cobalt transport system substrate-binding protein